MPVHPDLTAFRAVDACGGTYSAEEREERWAEGHKAALEAACEAVKASDTLTGELLAAVKELKELFRFALLSTSVSIAKDGMVFVRKAEAVIAKAEGRS